MKWGLFQWHMVTKGPHFPCIAIGKIVRCISRQQPGAEGLIPLCSPQIYDSQKGMLDQAVLEHFGVNHHSLNCSHQPALRCLSCSCQSVWITSTLPAGLISMGRWEVADCTSLRCWEHPAHRKECWVIILQTADLFGTRDWFCGRQFFHRSGGGGVGVWQGVWQGAERWFGDYSSPLHLLCTLFLFLFHQLHLRSSGIRPTAHAPQQKKPP